MSLLRYCFLSSVFILISLAGFAQESTKTKRSLKEHLVFGGGVTFNIQNNATLIGASPVVGYRVTDRYTTGVGISFMHISNPYGRRNIYSGSVWNRFSVIDEAFLAAEFEYGSIDIKESFNGTEYTSTRDYPAFLVGGGYRQGGGGGISFNVMILYDLIQDPNSPYNDLIYRGGIGIGF